MWGCRGLFYIISASIWKNWGNIRRMSIRIASLRAENRTLALSNMTQECTSFIITHRVISPEGHFLSIQVYPVRILSRIPAILTGNRGCFPRYFQENDSIVS
jgi:hypothetical protein